jgi:hypothetical protein
MIGWIDNDLRLWGRWRLLQGENLGYQKKTVIGRLMETDGKLVGCMVYESSAPIDIGYECMKINRAIKDLPENNISVLNEFYGKPKPKEEKARKLHLSVKTMYRKLHKIHEILEIKLKCDTKSL